jgi:hypothetical protein
LTIDLTRTHRLECASVGYPAGRRVYSVRAPPTHL